MERPPLAQPDPPPGAQRYANIDRLRLIALSDIVAFHVTGMHFLLGVGLPIFLLFMAALNARPPRDPDPVRFVKRKAAAFLLPWAAWSVVYALMFTLTSLHNPKGMFHWFEPEMLVLGTQWHLWYLVFGLVASLAAFFARRWTARFDGFLVILLASILGCLTMVGERLFADPPAQAAPWLLSLPSIPIGIALARCLWEHDEAVRRRNTIFTLAIIVAGMGVLELIHEGYSAERYMVAMVPVGAAILWRGVPDAVTTWLTNLRLGIYLIHPLMIRATMSLFADRHEPALQVLTVLLASIAGVWLISHSPLRWMVQLGSIGEATPKSPPPRFPLALGHA